MSEIYSGYCQACGEMRAELFKVQLKDGSTKRLCAFCHRDFHTMEARQCPKCGEWFVDKKYHEEVICPLVQKWKREGKPFTLVKIPGRPGP